MCNRVIISPDADLYLHKPEVEGNQLYTVPICVATVEGIFSSKYVSNITVLHTVFCTEGENFGHSAALSSELCFRCSSI